MSSPFSVQGLAGLAAMIAVAFIAIAPIAGGVLSVGEARERLTERQNAAAALADRMQRDRRELMAHPDLFKRSLGDFEAAAVSTAVRAQCEQAANAFAGQNIAADCAVASVPLSGALLRHDAVLTASGGISNLLAGLDKMEAGARIDRLAIDNDPQRVGAMLEVRFMDVSAMAEASE